MKYFYKLLIISFVLFSVDSYCGNNSIKNPIDQHGAHSTPAITPPISGGSDSVKQEQKIGVLTHPCPSERHDQINDPKGVNIHRLFPQWIMGYYVVSHAKDYPINLIDWTDFTHIIAASVRVNSDETLKLDFDDPDHGEQNAKSLAEVAHANCVKALLMLGGGDGYSDGLMKATADDKKLADFVKKLLSAMDNFGYDGIDLDWEETMQQIPQDATDEKKAEIEKLNQEKEKQSHVQLASLAKALRAARGDHIILTYPAFPINSNIQDKDKNGNIVIDPNLVQLADSLDRLNVQTYIPAAAEVGQGWSSWFVAPLDGSKKDTPISVKDSLESYAAAGIPKWKLGMGTAFYAVCYTNKITGPNQDTTGSEIKGGDNNYPLSKFYAADGIFADNESNEKKYDSVAAQPYLTFPVPHPDSNCGVDTQYISYENEASLIEKGKFSKKNGYGGIIIWTLQQGWLPPIAAEGRKPNALMQALKKGFIDP